MKRLLTTLLGLLVTVSTVARADDDSDEEQPRWCRLERIDPAPLKDDRLRLYTSVVTLHGKIVEGMHAPEFTLFVDKKPAGKAEKVQSFSSMSEEVDVALVVETAAQYKKAIDRVKEALGDFLKEQPASMKVTLISFGSEISRPTRLLGAPMMADEVDKLEVDDDSADVRMVDALRLAVGELRKLDSTENKKVQPRRVIVLVSDGLNAKMDRGTFKEMGKLAAQEGIPIHSVAYSPIDERGPLLALGDLSKRSNGTFRWAKTADDLPGQLTTLADEIRKQYVLTFKTDLSSTKGHVFSVKCRQVMSEKMAGAGVKGGTFGRVAEESSGLAWYWWVLIAVGALVALFVLLMVLAGIRERQMAQGGVPAPKPPKVKPAPQARPTAARVASSGSGRMPAVAAAGGQARRATLIAVTGPLAGQRFALAGTVSVGKNPGHGITVAGDAACSGNHCEFRAEGGGVVVRDLGSTNGTWVNGRRVVAPQQLRDGDLIRCGLETQFKLRLE